MAAWAAFGARGSGGVTAAASVRDAASEFGARLEGVETIGFGVRGREGAGGATGTTALVFGTAGGMNGTGAGAVVLGARGNSCLARSARTGSTVPT